MRYLYLVRHGEALPGVDDSARPLSEAGRNAISRLASWAATAGIEVDVVRHSGKLRAQQTAEIIALALGTPVEAAAGLNPTDDIEPWEAELSADDRSVMLVGHLPFLSRLLSLLLVGNPDKPIARFDPGALIGLSRQQDRWAIACAVQPRFNS